MDTKDSPPTDLEKVPPGPSPLPGSKVYKSNDLIEAAYQLSLAEQRILLACMAKLDSRKPVKKDTEFKVTAAEYSDTFDVPIKQSYEALQEAADRLFERKIKMADEKGRWTREIRWLQEKAVYHGGQGAVSFIFSDRVKGHLTRLAPPFTKYQLEKVSGLNSYYSVRLYEILIRWRDTGLLRISLDDFKRRMGIEDKYPRFPDFKRRIIVPAVQDLEAKSNLEITWDVKREKRAVVGLEFRFQEKDQMALDLGED
ncbi:MAG: replication initiation protein [Candidatus Thiodiazotropha lotti]|nr:replication initiation protein [Candidatus Thiodiazotropha lotti]